MGQDTPERFSDRKRIEGSTNEKEMLANSLAKGHDKAFYRRELEKRGWKVTSVNYDKPDYVEYEIVKDNATFEVQIDFDENSKKASSVDVVTNVWRAEATEKEMTREDRKEPKDRRASRN